jgi:hypothetical protein
MGPSKCEMTSGVQGHDISPLQTGCVQAPHAEKTTQHARSQVSVGRSPGVSQEMIQGVVYRPGLLLGFGQSVEIVQDFGTAGIEIEIELAATGELEQVQADPPPNEEPLVVDDQRQKTRIGDVIEPPVKLGPEVEDGRRQGLAETYNRPFRRFCSWAWLRTRARLSWEISWSRRLSRRCSSIHERTSSLKSIGT